MKIVDSIHANKTLKSVSIILMHVFRQYIKKFLSNELKWKHKTFIGMSF